jgi:hypothetical protein
LERMTTSSWVRGITASFTMALRLANQSNLRRVRISASGLRLL